MGEIESVSEVIRSHFREIQKQNKFVSDDLGLGLSISLSTLMIEIDSGQRKTVQELANGLRLDKSTVSRNLTALEARGFIRRRTSDLDRRVANIELTSAGQRYIDSYDRKTDEIFKRQVSPLSSEEKRAVYLGVKAINDYHKTPEGVLRKNDHEIRVEMRRLAKTLGMLKPNFFNSSVSVFEWQLLIEAVEHGGSVSSKHLLSTFGARPNTLSATLKRLKDRNLISVSSHPVDKRQIYVRITNEGIKMMSRVNRDYSSLIATSFRKSPLIPIVKFERALSKYAGSMKTTSKLEIDKIDSTKSLNLARRYLIEQLVTKHIDYPYPGTLLREDSMNFALKQDGTLLGVVEILRERGSYKVGNIVVSEVVSSAESDEFLKRSLELARKSRKA